MTNQQSRARRGSLTPPKQLTGGLFGAERETFGPSFRRGQETRAERRRGQETRAERLVPAVLLGKGAY